LKITKLDWDSDFFGRNIYQIFAESPLVKLTVPEACDVLFLKSENPLKCNVVGFDCTYEEEKVVFTKNIKPDIGALSSEILSVQDISINMESLCDLAYLSGHSSRYNLDVKFSREEFEGMYRQWIINALETSFQDDILIYNIDNVISGMITFKVSDFSCHVGLISVLNNAQGKGIGRKLLEHLEHSMSLQGVSRVVIPTQRKNVSAMGFYQKIGYHHESSEFCRHYWRNTAIKNHV
tara:strand:- start:577 stop:1284 length:708 start_codon:yes stop_codon:yes gene_type:complete